MFTIERTKAALISKINEAISSGTTEIDLVVKATGDPVTITLCSFGNIKSIDDIEYYLVDFRFPWAGSSRIDDIANLLNNWTSKIEEENSEKKQIIDYYNKYYGTDKFDADWFSDWHKDVFGFRPHGKPAWM
jgi:hypothetical protein